MGASLAAMVGVAGVVFTGCEKSPDPLHLDNPFDPPRRIRWGLQSTDEMGSITLLLVPCLYMILADLDSWWKGRVAESEAPPESRAVGSAAGQT